MIEIVYKTTTYPMPGTSAIQYEDVDFWATLLRNVSPVFVCLVAVAVLAILVIRSVQKERVFRR